MEREILWQPKDELGMEHLRLTQDERGVMADGLVIGVAQGQPFRVRYMLHCNAQWQIQEVHVAPVDVGQPDLHLLADGQGHWTTSDGEKLSTLEGCLDVDISVTPFTNTLPIRRLRFHVGQAIELSMAYIAVPTLSFLPVRQRYTCLEQRTDGALFRYEGLESGFTAEVSVDEDGLVTDYGTIWHRVWSR